jgi:hypothetical protein
MLTVPIEREHHFGCGGVHASRQRGLMTEVAAELQQGHTRVGFGNLPNRRRRPIAGAVIHVDEMEIVVKRIHNIANAPVGLLDNPLLVEDGDNKVNSLFLCHGWDFTILLLAQSLVDCGAVVFCRLILQRLVLSAHLVE